ncbi:MAG: ABC transporter substrate-binding protein [Oscillospiraceae bacterium]|nr:ABC transporter substrate-binding protein [Oscillospiraceae bacterium]
MALRIMRQKVVLFVFIFTIVLTSCTIEPKLSSEVADSKSLTIAVLGAPSCEFNKYISYYHEKYPDIVIEFIQDEHIHHHNDDSDLDDCDEDSFFEKTYTDLLNGDKKADLIILNSYNMISFVQDGLIIDISQNEAIRAAFDNQEMMDGVKRLCSYDDVIAGVPLNIHYQGLAVNQQLFDLLGIAPPSYEWTYDDLYILGQSLNQYNIESDNNTYLMMPERTSCRYINPIYGIDMEQRIAGFANQRFIDYMQKGKDLDEMKLFYYPDHLYINSMNDLLNLKYSENMLFHEVLYSELHDYDNARFKDMFILPLPQVMGYPPSFSAILLCISSNAENMDIAEHFLASFICEEYQYENAFEMQIYKDASKYSIMGDYSFHVAEWIAYTTEHSAPLNMPLHFWEWYNTLELPQGTRDSIDFSQWAHSTQIDAQSHMH